MNHSDCTALYSKIIKPSVSLNLNTNKFKKNADKVSNTRKRKASAIEANSKLIFLFLYKTKGHGTGFIILSYRMFTNKRSTHSTMIYKSNRVPSEGLSHILSNKSPTSSHSSSKVLPLAHVYTLPWVLLRVFL